MKSAWAGPAGPAVAVDTASRVSSASVAGACVCGRGGRAWVREGGPLPPSGVGLDCRVTTVPFKRLKQQLCCKSGPQLPPAPPVHFRLPLPSLPSPTPAPGSSCPLRGGQQSSWELSPGSGEGRGAGRWWKLVLVQAKAGDFFAKGTFLFKIERAGFISQKRQVRDGRRGRLRLSLAG